MLRTSELSNSTERYDQFILVLQQMNVNQHKDELMIIFEFYDRKKEGTIKYRDLVSSLRGYMSEYRQALVEKTYESLSSSLNHGQILTKASLATLFSLEFFGSVERDSQCDAIASEFMDLIDIHSKIYVG